MDHPRRTTPHYAIALHEPKRAFVFYLSGSSHVTRGPDPRAYNDQLMHKGEM
jgi:hypothetical protein